MRPISRIVDFITLGSDRPIRRLIAYYVFLAIVFTAVAYFLPTSQRLLLGQGLESRPGVSGASLTSASPAASTAAGQVLLQDGLSGAAAAAAPRAVGQGLNSLAELAMGTTLILLGTLVLMLPVSWVYMSARQTPGHSQAVVQTLIILPLVVAGIVLIVRDSLALAFSLAGVVAAVRFRTNLRDTRDVVFIFLAIAVGFAAGVQTLAVGAILTVVFNFVLLFTWRYDYGRNVLTPTAASQWAGPLTSLATEHEHDAVPDRDLVLSLSPEQADALAERFERVSDVLGAKKKKARYTAVLSVMSNRVAEAQEKTEKVLDRLARRWRLDEVVQNTGKPSEIYYLVRPKKSVTRDDLLTAIRDEAGDFIQSTDLESRDAVEENVGISAG